MSDWVIHVHVDDEETARNMVDELNGEGYGVSLYKRQLRESYEPVLQFALLPNGVKKDAS